MGWLPLDPSLRFVDVAHPDTLAEMRMHLAVLAVDLGHRDVDLSTITSGDRRLTQRVARSIYDRTDNAGQPAFAGLRYVSRHGAPWECWAFLTDRLVGAQLPVQRGVSPPPAMHW